MKFWGGGLLFVVLGLAPGCQCHPEVRDASSDVVDCINDNQPTFDHLYHPAFDLTRIGQPDWCRSPVNRFLCGKGCRNKECSSY